GREGAMGLALYSTSKEVNLLDRRLGLVHLVILVLVLAYVFGSRIFLDKGYQAVEEYYGSVGITLKGRTYETIDGLVQPADQADLMSPIKEGAALFLATTSVITPQQRLGNCTDPTHPCASDADCAHDAPLSTGVCDAGSCVRQTWCPVAATADSGTQNTQLEGLDNLAITLMGTINFPKTAPDVLTTEDGRNARVTWSLPEVLQRGGVNAVEALSQGAVVSLVLKWSCHFGISGGFSLSCLPRLQVSDLGSNQGFTCLWANYYQVLENGANVLHRDLHNATGIRFLVSSRGTARTISINQCILQLVVLLCLLPLANALADTIMQTCFSERRHYREYKTETTPDFSDVRAKVEQLDNQQKSQKEKLLAYGEGEPV
ncbi:MAG: hypothetical protein SGPRY_013976, partial [Prymnesium sp.]